MCEVYHLSVQQMLVYLQFNLKSNSCNQEPIKNDEKTNFSTVGCYARYTWLSSSFV